MKIAIVLPLTDNFTKKNAGAASLYVNETTDLKNSNIKVFGSTNFKDFINKKNYINIENISRFPSGKNHNYCNKIVNYLKKKKFDLIEIHNRPQIFTNIKSKINSKYIIYFHNDPQGIRGSVTPNERADILNKADKIVFISEWIKSRFFENIQHKNSDKTEIVYHGIYKNVKKLKKEKIITFAGKLNYAKGYDIFCKAAKKFLKKNNEWIFYSIGDEPRAKIKYNHPKFKYTGWINHSETIKLFKKSSITVVPSLWEEPLGRVSIESSSLGNATLISNKGGLPETLDYPIILKNLNSEQLFKELTALTKNKNNLKKYQKLNQFSKTQRTNLKFIKEQITKIRQNLITKKININLNKPIKILHIADLHLRHNSRLYYSTIKKLNFGFIKNNINLQNISDRDVVKFNRSILDNKATKFLEKIIIENFNSFKPDICLLGHVDNLSKNFIDKLKIIYPGSKFAQWFLDPIIQSGPDFKKNTNRLSKQYYNCDANFITTNPDVIKIKNKSKLFYLPNVVDENIDYLENYKYENHPFDLFVAISHGQHRGVLKKGKIDERSNIIKLIEKNNLIKFLTFGDQRQPIWGDEFFYYLSRCSMALNLSRGFPIKHYSSDRIASLMGNGLLTFIDKEYFFSDFFNKNEIVEYSSMEELNNKINFYKINTKERQKIAENGKKKYFDLFNSKRITKYIVDKTLGVKTKMSWE